MDSQTFESLHPRGANGQFVNAQKSQAAGGLNALEQQTAEDGPTLGDQVDYLKRCEEYAARFEESEYHQKLANGYVSLRLHVTNPDLDPVDRTELMIAPLWDSQKVDASEALVHTANMPFGAQSDESIAYNLALESALVGEAEIHSDLLRSERQRIQKVAEVLGIDSPRDFALAAHDLSPKSMYDVWEESGAFDD